MSSQNKIALALSHYFRRIQAAQFSTEFSVPTILHWKPSPGNLVPWNWPCTVEGQRVPPCELENHRQTHEFQAPCCLCPALKKGSDAEIYTETRIGLVQVAPKVQYGRHPLNGQYAVQCARNHCGYFICLEWFYALPLMHLRYYKKRDTPLPAHELTYISDLDYIDNNDLGLYQASPGIICRGTKRRELRRDG
ncbi:hypothetical protein FA15DRAFT_711757 [Coprinopsis marcescibilis]|uniref:Uncharacterized protein n=1 Tax=Coprinopsis marcescibilis TaxID=230819 RepID=A0A5C3K9F5_COPMA|nr:hypothetical protein FA15DRAFT_711757 [Coprinopsis marcescibilis]